MRKQIAIFATAALAGGAFAQGSSSSDAPVTTGQGATSGGTLPSSGGAIVRPGSPGSSTTTMGSSGTGLGSGAMSGAPGGTPPAASGSTMDRAGKDCPPGQVQKDNGCQPAGQVRKPQP